eukprot:5295298-Amphidinium_carterae.1
MFVTEGITRTWIVDTGVAQHLVGRWHLTSEEVDTAHDITPVRLSTANGVIRAPQRVSINLPGLGDLSVEPLILDSSPCVLSVGQLRAAGFGFVWMPNELYLVMPDGTR